MLTMLHQGGTNVWPDAVHHLWAQAVADTGAAPVLESDSSLDEADSIDPSLLASLDESLLAANDDFREV